MPEPRDCVTCKQPIVDAEPGVIVDACALLDALEDVLEHFEDHQFERARAVVARVRSEPEDTVIRKLDAILKSLVAQDWDGAENAMVEVRCWLDEPGAYVPTADIERAREALREPERPSYDDLLELAKNVALGNTEYDTLSSLADRLIEGGEYEIGASDDDEEDEQGAHATMAGVTKVDAGREDLLRAAKRVVGRWENGNLAEAVRELADAVAVATGKESHD